VPVDVTAYNASGSAPLVGSVTGTPAVNGNPVDAVTPAPPTKHAADADTKTPSLSGADDPITPTRVAAVPTLV